MSNDIEAACRTLENKIWTVLGDDEVVMSAPVSLVRTVIAAARESEAYRKAWERDYDLLGETEAQLAAEREQRQQLFESAAGWSAEAIKQEKRAEQAEQQLRLANIDAVNEMACVNEAEARVSVLEAALQQLQSRLGCGCGPLFLCGECQKADALAESMLDS